MLNVACFRRVRGHYGAPLLAAEHFRLLVLGCGTSCHRRLRRHRLWRPSTLDSIRFWFSTQPAHTDITVITQLKKKECHGRAFFRMKQKISKHTWNCFVSVSFQFHFNCADSCTCITVTLRLQPVLTSQLADVSIPRHPAPSIPTVGFGEQSPTLSELGVGHNFAYL